MSALISAPSLCETNLTSYIFTPDARERLRASFTGVSVRPVAASPSSAGPLATQRPLSPEASPPSDPKGNGVTREDRNGEREKRGRLKRNEDDSGNKR